MRQFGRPAVWERGYIAPRDPGTALMATSLVMSAAGTGASIMGQGAAAGAAAGQANYQAQVARNNQILMQRNATLATQQGEVDVQNQELKTGQIEGSQRASLAAQGGDVNVGSPVDIVSDTARAGQQDVDTIRYNAALKAYGFETEAGGYGGTASAYGTTAANATANLPFAEGSTLLGGLSSASNKFYAMWLKNPASPSGGDAIPFSAEI